MATSSNTHDQNIAEICKYDNGTTIYEGDNIIDKNKINKYPIISHIDYLFTEIANGEFTDAFFSIATGAVPTPPSELLSGNVTYNGEVQGFEGPGYLSIENDKINVYPPGEFVYGFNTPYIQAKIVPTGIDIINNKTNETIGHLDPSTMTNDTIPGLMVDDITLKYWYNHYPQGAKYNLEFCLDGFNDNRSYITPEEMKERFPDVYNYSVRYPGGSPVILYGKNYTETEVSSTYTYLDSHPQYNDANREYNAKQFVKAWNGTVIPANVSGCGRDGVAFSAVPEKEAESGMATHGVCPPARSLREAVLALGFSLPVGMDSGRDAVLYGYSPSTGIRVTNSLSYPIKITMWTEGSGPGMEIHTVIYELIPNSYLSNSTNSTNSTDSTNTTNY